jgi:peptidoglycan/LPS O-acetylase OafA/YrhL
MKYIKQLDALRAVAVSLVIIGHWLPETNFLNRVTNNANGYIGVTIFFVLSGFLITWILLENRLTAEAAALKKGTVIKQFFIRRALRIFPVYYITIFALYIFGQYTGTHIREDFIYFLTYTVNINIFKNQQWDGMLAHLWSLSVEEQFYLIWPWIILFCRKAYLQSVIIGFILLGTISSYLFTTPAVDCLTTSCFDAFGLGALLSLQLVFHPEALRKFYTRARLAGLIGLVLFVITLLIHQTVYIPLRTLLSCVSLWVITYIVLNRNKTNMLNRVLNNNWLVGMGRISYGIYLFHLPLIYGTTAALNYLVKRHLLSLPGRFYLPVLLVSSFVLLILLAMASWQWIEKPFLRLKKYFELKPAVQQPHEIKPAHPLHLL